MSSILFLTHVLPYPLDAGPKARAYYVLRYLAQRHDVTLVSFARAEDRPEHLEHLRHFCRDVQTVPMRRSLLRTAWATAATLTSREPIIVKRDEDGAMRSLLRTLTAAHPFDCVHVDQTSMVQYGLFAAGMVAPAPRLILDAHNALFKVFARLAHQMANPIYRQALVRESRRLRRYEHANYRRFHAVVFVAEEDRQEFQLPHAKVIPICGAPAETAPVPRRQPGRCLFLGALHWPPNAEGVRWFVAQVWPRIAASQPDLQLTVIGRQPPSDIAATTARNVEVLGYVDNLDPYLAQTSVFVVPLWSGGGMRVKLVDAWTWGLPIVSTSIGAEGTAYAHGRNLLIADTPAEFADAVVRIHRDAGLAQRLREEGRRTALAHYDWRTVYRAWDAVYETGDSAQPARIAPAAVCPATG